MSTHMKHGGSRGDSPHWRTHDARRGKEHVQFVRHGFQLGSSLLNALEAGEITLEEIDVALINFR